MGRRIDIELTSHVPDGTWTWRAAGAKQPKGSLEPSALPEGAAVGEVLRAEVQTGLDGIEILSVQRIKPPSEKPVNRIEVLGTPAREADRPSEGGGARRQHRGAGEGGSARTEGRRRAGRREGASGSESPARRDRSPRRAGTPRREAVGREPGRDRRPSIPTVHRDALLNGLRSEQLPVAEQLLRGGIPAVRQAIDAQNAKARQERRAPVQPAPLLAMAEELAPSVNLAAWKDRATAAKAAGKDTRVRELRTLVTASRSLSLDEESRTLARTLADALEQRVRTLQEEWTGRITAGLEAGRVLDALRTTARPPEPGTRLNAELARRLAEAASAAMEAGTPPREWLELLEAVTQSPVRRTVRPGGIPDDEDARAAARGAAGLVPELAKLLGLRIPPPPPRRTARRPPVNAPVGAGRGGGP